MRTVLTIAFVILPALALLVPVRQAAADSPTVVSCDGFILGYDGQAKQKKCSTEDIAGGRTESRHSEIEIKDDKHYLVVFYDAGEFRTYYPFRSPRQLLAANTSFSKILTWTSLPDTRGFTVIAFKGVLASNGKSDICALFARYSGVQAGPYEYPDGPGYKNRLSGFYCPRAGFPSTDAGSDSVKALDDALGRIQAPAS